MTLLRLLLRSLRWHRRQLLAVASAVAVAVAVLTGALVVGWSLQESLHDRLVGRLAGVERAASLTHPAPASLAGELRKEMGPRLVGALELRAVAGSADQAQAVAIPAVVWGVDEGTWAGATDISSAGENGVIVNAKLAGDLGLRKGDDIALRVDCSPLLVESGLFTVRKPSETTRVLRLTIAQIMPAGEWADFTLAQSQTTSANVFVPLATLCRGVGKPPAINQILLTDNPVAASWSRVLDQRASLGDLGFALKQGVGRQYLQSQRIEVPPWAKAAAEPLQGGAGETCTFLAEGISSGRGQVSYGVVASQYPKEQVGEDEVILNEWVASDLRVAQGDVVTVTFLMANPDGSYGREALKLKVVAVRPVGTELFEQAVVPEVAGMTEVRQMDQWKTPFPVDMGKVTPRDEQYWEQHRATPKAIISDRLMQRLWQASGFVGTRATTALVLPANVDRARLSQTIAQHDPELTPVDVRRQAEQAGQGSSDFSGLFVGMSMFLVAASLVIATAIVRVAVESRAGEFGLASAVGIGTGRWQLVPLMEQALASVPGIVLGTALGVVYARGLLWVFSRVSNEIWEIPPLRTRVQWGALVGVGLGVALLVLGVTWWQSRRQLRRPVRELLWGVGEGTAGVAARPRRWSLGLAILLVTGAILAALVSRLGRLAPSEGFFVVAMCLLLGAWLLMRWAASRPWPRGASGMGLGWLCVRSTLGDRRRLVLSWTTYTVAAFTLCSVALYRSAGPSAERYDLAGPTGGLTFRVTSPIAYRYDLGTEQGRRRIGMDEQQAKLPEGTVIYSLPASDGSEGGCLNLAQPTEMQVIGVTGAFAARAGFEVQAAKHVTNPWTLLDEASDAIPVFGDEETMQWIVKHSVGDVFTMPMAGKPTQLRLAGVIRGGLFSGQLLMSEQSFRRVFPGDTGYRFHFVQSTKGASPQLVGFRELGMVVEDTAAIVRSVQAVQGLYMTLFLVLGGLGLLLGAVGSVALLVRDALQRQGELALLQATGLSRGQCTLVLSASHLLPLAGGLAAGCLTACAAYLAVQRPTLSVWGLILPAGVTLIAAAAMVLISRRMQPSRPSEALRSAA